MGHVTFSIGTDTAGSGRVPAGLNGCVGVKPTVGSISTVGAWLLRLRLVPVKVSVIGMLG
jgi:Asp-tRNA(Asn)/Glu-tRNA(Gln) amidotransferase A subunit family amidase